MLVDPRILLIYKVTCVWKSVSSSPAIRVGTGKESYEGPRQIAMEKINLFFMLLVILR